MTDQTTDALLAKLPGWERFFDDYDPPPILQAKAEITEIRRRIVNLRRRLRDGPHAPLRLAFFGPTGSGKSKLFSSLVGKNLSQSGFRRPFTRRAFYYVSARWRALTAALAGEVEVHDDAEWEDAILVDTPDFDSVEADNRAEAERVYLEADGFLFVTDGLKYADASTWEYLTRIHACGKLFSVILNKVNSEGVIESFRQRYHDTLPSRSDEIEAATPSTQVPHVVVPELPLADDELIPAEHEAMQTLRKVARQMASTAGPATSARMFAQEARGLVTGTSELGAKAETLRHEIQQVQRNNRQRLREAQVRLEERMLTGIAPEVRDEVYQRVLKRLEKIDLLRYPRKLLLLPINGLRSLLSKYWPSSKPKEATTSATDPITSETFHLLEAELIRLADESRLDIINRPGLEGLMDRATYQSLRMDHEEAKRRFKEHYEDFTQWLAEHARETASEITGENKAKFILSQVLFNTLLITAQVHTGGAMSLFEIGMDGVLSPFVAKVIGMGIGSEKVKEFEAQAHDYHQQSLGKILSDASNSFVEFLDDVSENIQSLELELRAIHSQADAIDVLIEDFQRQASQQESAGEG